MGVEEERRFDDDLRFGPLTGRGFLFVIVLIFFFEITCRAGQYLANVRRTFAGLTP
jgi:hypothetical protein